LVTRDLAKVETAGSSPVYRSWDFGFSEVLFSFKNHYKRTAAYPFDKYAAVR
jgi:hypothetical protein